MRIIRHSVEIWDGFDGDTVLRKLEQAGRVCYKSEARAGEDTAGGFVKRLIERGHESVIEHFGFSARFICDRGVSHEIVRHRLASYSQESTRFCNYLGRRFGNEITFIEPVFFIPGTDEFKVWRKSCLQAEESYFRLLEMGCKPDEARSVLPNSLKTELIMTANIREWRHFFKLRTSPAAHPQMQDIAKMLLREARERIPVVFDDVGSVG